MQQVFPRAIINTVLFFLQEDNWSALSPLRIGARFYGSATRWKCTFDLGRAPQKTRCVPSAIRGWTTWDLASRTMAGSGRFPASGFLPLRRTLGPLLAG